MYLNIEHYSGWSNCRLSGGRCKDQERNYPKECLLSFVVECVGVRGLGFIAELLECRWIRTSGHPAR